jgi:hypothetical protein
MKQNNANGTALDGRDCCMILGAIRKIDTGILNFLACKSKGLVENQPALW